MWTSTTAWLATLVAGLIIGLVLHAVAGRRSRSTWWAAGLAGLVGAAIGRVVLDFPFFTWHPRFSGGVVGALVVSAIWLGVKRGGRAAG